MSNKYQIELEEFNEHFKEFKQSRIVLYRIGRYIATLVEGLKDEIKNEWTADRMNLKV